MSQLLALYMGSLMLRSVGVAVIAGIGAWKMRNAAMRHAVWVIVLAAMLLIPVIDGLLPARWVPNRIQQTFVEKAVVTSLRAVTSTASLQIPSPELQPTAMPAHARSWDWWKIAAGLYLLVAAAMLIRLVSGYLGIWRLKTAARVVTNPVWDEVVAAHPMRWRMPGLCDSNSVRVPLTVGFLKPVVILPTDWQNWDEWKLHAALQHEFAHVRRADWVIAAVAASAKCAFWLNPLSWFLERQLSELAEHASDDASLAWSRNTTRYAEVLLEFAAAARNGSRLIKGGVAMAQHRMRSRIERVLADSYSGTGFLNLSGWTLVFLLATPVLYSAAALHVASGRAPVPELPNSAIALQARTESGQAGVVSKQKQLELPGSHPQLVQVPQTGKPSGPTLVALQGPAVTNAAIQEVQSTDIQKIKYVIKPMDSLTVFVYGHPELSMDVTVQPDGQISIPLVQNLQAAGLSADQLKASAEKRLSEFLQAPNVTIILKVIQSYRVFMIGKVQKPGVLNMEQPITVLQALALAGGFQDFARRNEITITRTIPPQDARAQQEIRMPFNYEDILQGKNSLTNIYLESGDVVNVP